MLTHARPTGYNRHGACVPAFQPKDYDWVNRKAKAKATANRPGIAMPGLPGWGAKNSAPKSLGP